MGSDNPISDSKGNPIFTTVCHGGKKHKLYYYTEKKNFHCYTDCSENMDIFLLVEKAKHISFPKAVKYVANITGKNYSVSIVDFKGTEVIDDWQWISKFEKKQSNPTDLPIYNKNVLDVFMPYPHQNWIEEGIGYETIREFNIGYYFRDTQEAITIPHYDLRGNLIGIRRRSMVEEDIENGRKYMPITIEDTTYSYPMMFNLYGLHKTKDAIQRLKKVCLWESEKSVYKCEDIYGENNYSVATCSTNISKYQAEILLSLGVEEVIVGFDKEFENPDSEEAHLYAEQLLRKVKKLTPYFTTYILWDNKGLLGYKDSPIDKGQEVLEELMRSKYEIKTMDEVIE